MTVVRPGWPGASDPPREDWLENRLRELVEGRPEDPVDEQELRHLVHVILNSSRILREVYTDDRLRQILKGDVDLALPRFLLEAADPSEADGPLSRLTRLPEDIREVGDRCLFDVGISGRTEIRGLPLEDLGVRAYKLASNLLDRLADDRLLRRYFEGNRLWPLPLDEEVTFLQQCARRFQLHAELLRSLELLGPAAGEGGRATRPGSPLEVGSGAPAAGRLGEDVAIGEPRPAEPAAEEIEAHGVSRESGPEARAESTRADSPRRDTEGGSREFVGRTASARDEARDRSRNELLSAYERLLLFSTLDVDQLRREMTRLVVGQRQAVDTLCDEFTLYAAGTHDPDRPSSYFFVGPTGVGKNYLVETMRSVLESLWGIEIPYLQIEGPNYTDASDINELRGSARGFIRSDEEGILSEFHERAAKSAFSVILVDEVEKAHAQLRKFFLPLMDRGTVTDNRGRILRFAGSMVVFTSNLGHSESASVPNPIGYFGEERRDAAEKADAERGLRRALSPEFMNRLKIVRFGHLAPESIERIFDLELGRIAARFRDLHGLDLVVTASARGALIEQGYSRQFGARHLAAVLNRHCNIEVARKIRRDESTRDRGERGRADLAGLVDWIRSIRSGERAFSRDEVHGKVMREARARLPYSVLEIDEVDGAFSYRGVT